MATQTGTVSGKITGREYRIEWSTVQSIADNATTITCVHKLINSSGYSLNIAARNNVGTNINKCTVNGETKNYASPAIKTSGGTTHELGVTTHVVKHNSDGTIGSISIKGVFNIMATLSGKYVTSITATGTIELNDIPRASSLSLSVSSVNVLGSITANITRATTSFVHDVEFYINSTYYKKYTGVGTSQAYQIPEAWYAAMPSSSSCTAYCRITTRDSAGTQIGSQVTKSFTVNVPSTVVPSVEGIELSTDPYITTQDGNSRNILVKGKNKMKVRAYGCKAGKGSSIKSYTFQAIYNSTIIATASITSTSTDVSTTLGPFSQTGAITFKVIVADSRQRSASKQSGWECHDYASPSFGAFNAYRANSDASANTNGEWLMCTYTPRYSGVNGTNSATVTVYYNDGTQLQTATGKNGQALISLGNNDKTYRVYLTINDNYGGSAQSSTIVVFGQSRIFNITPDGTGFAIGKMAEKNNWFECRWDAKFDGDIYSKNDTIVTSDKMAKKDIANMSTEQERLFNELRPVTFKFKDGSGDRTHYGFISQDIEEALFSLDLTGKDFAGFCKNLQIDGNGNPVIDENGQAVYDYFLRYSEFIALNTYMIQKLQAENAELRSELQGLKELIVGTSSKNID